MVILVFVLNQLVISYQIASDLFVFVIKTVVNTESKTACKGSAYMHNFRATWIGIKENKSSHGKLKLGNLLWKVQAAVKCVNVAETACQHVGKLFWRRSHISTCTCQSKFGKLSSPREDTF